MFFINTRGNSDICDCVVRLDYHLQKVPVPDDWISGVHGVPHDGCLHFPLQLLHPVPILDIQS